jgi:hypothetical protein
MGNAMPEEELNAHIRNARHQTSRREFHFLHRAFASLSTGVFVAVAGVFVRGF